MSATPGTEFTVCARSTKGNCQVVPNSLKFPITKCHLFGFRFNKQFFRELNPELSCYGC